MSDVPDLEPPSRDNELTLAETDRPCVSFEEESLNSIRLRIASPAAVELSVSLASDVVK
jgi:hypothetical protein